jgi:hypothetical protein
VHSLRSRLYCAQCFTLNFSICEMGSQHFSENSALSTLYPHNVSWTGKLNFNFPSFRIARTNCMMLSPPGKTFSCSTDNKILHIYGTRRFITLFTINTPLVPILSQVKPGHTFGPYLFKINFDIILLSTHRSSKWFLTLHIFFGQNFV